MLYHWPSVGVGKLPANDDVVVRVRLKSDEHLAPTQVFVVGTRDLFFHLHVAAVDTSDTFYTVGAVAAACALFDIVTAECAPDPAARPLKRWRRDVFWMVDTVVEDGTSTAARICDPLLAGQWWVQNVSRRLEYRGLGRSLQLASLGVGETVTFGRDWAFDMLGIPLRPHCGVVCGAFIFLRGVSIRPNSLCSMECPRSLFLQARWLRWWLWRSVPRCCRAWGWAEEAPKAVKHTLLLRRFCSQLRLTLSRATTKAHAACDPLAVFSGLVFGWLRYCFPTSASCKLIFAVAFKVLLGTDIGRHAGRVLSSELSPGPASSCAHKSVLSPRLVYFAKTTPVQEKQTTGS